LPRDRNFLQFGCISRRYYCRSGQNGRLQTRLKPESHVLVFDRLLESGLSSEGVLALPVSMARFGAFPPMLVSEPTIL
jgi:hypothetical protein